MDENKGRIRRNTVWTTAAIGLALVVLIVLFLVSQRSTTSTILLPEDVKELTPVNPDKTSDEEMFVQVHADNVLSVIETLHRPAAYHQTSMLVLNADDAQQIRQADVWTNGSVMRADITNPYQTVSFLTDGTEAYIWYHDDEVPVQIPLDGTVSCDDMVGLLTYETLLETDPDTIFFAEHTVLTDPYVQCVYISTVEEDREIRYWVDLNTGLLYMAEVTESGRQIYFIEQNTLELLAEDDAAFDDRFVLPDGTAPFTA